MIKPIVAILLLLFSVQFLQARNCQNLFSANQPRIKKINPPQSIIYNSRWLLDKLFKEGMLEQLKNADPLNDHIPFLEEILIEAHKELYEKIMEEHGTILSQPTPIPEIRLTQLQELKISKAKIFRRKETVQKMIGKISSDIRSQREAERRSQFDRAEHYAFGILNIYNALTEALKERIENKTVTLQFYNLYHKFVVDIFSNTTYYKTSVERVQDELRSLRTDISNIENFIVGAEEKYFYFRTFANLDFFDFIELWPKVFPLGSIFQSKTTYDGNRFPEDAKTFQGHDQAHSAIFISNFIKLSLRQKLSLIKIFNFLTKYRAKLTQEEQIILGSNLFYSFHETYDLIDILIIFKEQNPRAENIANVSEYVNVVGKLTYNKLTNKNDLGTDYDLRNTDAQWFQQRLKTILDKVIQAYEEDAPR